MLIVSSSKDLQDALARAEESHIFRSELFASRFLAVG
jgi:hypothetical protein